MPQLSNGWWLEPSPSRRELMELASLFPDHHVDNPITPAQIVEEFPGLDDQVLTKVIAIINARPADPFEGMLPELGKTRGRWA